MAADHTTAIFAAELILLLFFGRMLGEVMSRVGQPAIFGQLLAGVLLGPSVFGALMPELRHMIFPGTPALKSMIDAVSQIGILLLLLLTGMETNLALVNRKRRAVISTSFFGIAVPFVCGVLLAYALPKELIPSPAAQLVTALFLGTALSISSVKIVAMVLMEVGAIRRDLGQLILATAILDDTIAWVIIAVIAGIAAHGTVSLANVGASLAGTALFLAVSLTVGPPPGGPRHPLVQRQHDHRSARHHGHSAGHAGDGPVDRAHRRAYRARRVRGGHAGWPIAHPDGAHRGRAQGLHHRLLQPGVLRRCGSRHGSEDAARSDPAAVHRSPSSSLPASENFSARSLAAGWAASLAQSRWRLRPGSMPAARPRSSSPASACRWGC